MDPLDDPADPRAVAFCSPERPDLFHAVAYRNDVWKADPWDVGSVHEEARATYRRLVEQAAAPSGASAGRILLLLGEAGSGKTHLMRAFRNWTHSGDRGYFGYMQMTSSTDHYGRYVLNNLIDSLDQPYDEPRGETSGLMRLSTALAESSRDVPHVRLDQIREDDLGDDCLARLIDALADQIVVNPRLNSVDFDLIRALLFLQRDDPRIKGRVLKYLRCEDLSEADRRLLGGLVPRHYSDAPQWIIQRLGHLIGAVESVPLVFCVDQLEDIYNLDEAPARFRRAIATLCDLTGRIPSSVVVISCLEDFYDSLRTFLTRPLADRLENDPQPIHLKGAREADEIVHVVSKRLAHLYESLGVDAREDEPTFPIPRDELTSRQGLRIRDVLSWCQDYRAACIAAGRVLGPAAELAGADRSGANVSTVALAQAWNDLRSGFPAEIPASESELAGLLCDAIRACSEEVEDGRWEAEHDGPWIKVERHAADQSVARILVGVCNRKAQGGGLWKQVAELRERAGDRTPVIVRSTAFPSNPQTVISQQLDELVARGGRRVVVEDADWRAMIAMRQFRGEHRSEPAFTAWLKEERPLSLLKSLRVVLDLDDLKRPSASLGAGLGSF